MLQVMERSAAEGGEAGAEDEPGVDEIRIGDDAFLQHAFGFLEIRLDQLLDELGTVRVRLALNGLAVLPAVNALAGLLAELAGVDLVLQDFWHLHVAGRLGERFAGVPGRHEPDSSQEINYPMLFLYFDSVGYEGWIGCEYRPRVKTQAGLGWAGDWGIRAP